MQTRQMTTLVLLIVIWLLCDVHSAIASSDVKIGDRAPDFELSQLGGEMVRLSELRGKVVLLTFLATWCPPCRVQMPLLQTLYDTFERSDFEILAVAEDPEGEDVTKSFVLETGVLFPILHNSRKPIIRASLYGPKTIPLMYLIDRDGKITSIIKGARDRASEEAVTFIRGTVKTP